MRQMEPSTGADLAIASGVAAIRETFEESGLAVGQYCEQTGSLLPDLKALQYLGRAITNTNRPIRYHARFFAADASHAHGTLQGNGELLDLCWIQPTEAIATLPLVDVTEFFLRELAMTVEGQAPRGPVRQGRRILSPLFRYRSEQAMVTYE